jgi:hypothetical protein
MRNLILGCVSVVAASLLISAGVRPAPPATYLTFNGAGAHADVASGPGMSVGARGLTIAVWMRPDSLAFASTEGSLSSQRYVYWLGKGQKSHTEWMFRMYSLTNPGPRANRISFYVFNPGGGRGCGAYFQDPIRAGEWMFVAGVVDSGAQTVSIYKNGVLRHTDSYASLDPGPRAGSAPVRIGSGDLSSYFKGAIARLRIWSRPLSDVEIRGLFESDSTPADGLTTQLLLDDGDGTTARDSIGGHDAALVDATWASGSGLLSAVAGSSGGGC